LRTKLGTVVIAALATSATDALPALAGSVPRAVLAAEVSATRMGGFLCARAHGVRRPRNNTNERTFISTVWPVGGVGNSLHVWLPGPTIAPQRIAALVAATSSLAFDYVVRQKIGGTNLNFFYIAQFPVFPPSFYDPASLDFIVQRVLELTYTSHSMAPFARDLAYDSPPFVWNEERRSQLRAELDAWYGLQTGDEPAGGEAQ
jgi:hypothetical protein